MVHVESSSGEGKDEYNPTFRDIKRYTARKSTTLAQPLTQTYATRKQVAKNATNSLKTKCDGFTAHFESETSVQKKRKLNRKIHSPRKIRKPTGAIYDENGVHITTLTDICECLNKDCLGCFFECPKCRSQKCSIECRVYRKYVVDQIEYQGYDKNCVIENPLFKH